MSWPFWILLLLAVFILLVAGAGGRARSTQSFSYRLLPSLLTAAERSFYGVLGKAVDAETVAFAKIRVADVLAPTKGLDRSNWRRAFNKISSKHFDFVLCRADTLAVVCAIELNDKSHYKSKRRKRDEFLRESCASAKLPLIEFDARRSYSIEDIKEQLRASSASRLE